MEYYEKDGQIAILVSGGFGAGWSTWNYQEVAYDKRIVEFWLSKKDDKQFMRNIDSLSDNATKKETKALFASWGYPNVYFGGFADIDIEWVNKGQPFIIDEYDGSETLQVMTDIPFIVLN